jgi:anti-sigma regulatory factor (Ser/Thr protein kinase)
VAAYAPPDEEEVELSLSCEPESAGTARRAIAELARRFGAPEDDVRLAVTEAVANAVVHAYRGGKAGTILVRARHERGRLLVTVADDGLGMAPNPDKEGLGLGIPLITKFCKDVRFSSSAEGTIVSMSFATADDGG